MLLQTRNARIVGLVGGLLLLTVCAVASIVMGYTHTSLKMAYDAFQHNNGSTEHLVIQNVRLPRALIAATVGASLGIAGALMQALTKNPLASPDIMGVNAGASFFIVVGFMLFSLNSLQAFAWVAFLGAAVAAMIVYLLGATGAEGLTPIRLTLAGAAIAAMFSSLTQGLLVLDETSLEQVLFWLAGSVQGRKLSILWSVFPYIAVAIVVSFFIAQKINILTMGDGVAKGLGQRTGTLKVVTALIIVVLSGGAVAIAGPITFIGIIIPHIVRFLVGHDYRWILPYSAAVGGIFLLIADIGARYVIMPEEVPVGVMTAIVGTPFFIYIARKGGQQS
ncbi:FecCD family ABC transporter permease [Priestia koreensis]|uniref:FecCD family ABC transporter permease n=1 Tax=Priestia koreensis TaxID=284581 RepID=UPI001F569A4B|nr:iron ABC transporter permease [Priestia koreensis]UNL84690.1 iron ABC transporter permease [Priestia koreensis]